MTVNFKVFKNISHIMNDLIFLRWRIGYKRCSLHVYIARRKEEFIVYLHNPSTMSRIWQKKKKEKKAIGLMSRRFTNGPGDRGSIIPKTQKMVAIPRQKNPICHIIYPTRGEKREIHAFLGDISTKWNAISPVHDLNPGHQFHFLQW